MSQPEDRDPKDPGEPTPVRDEERVLMGVSLLKKALSENPSEHGWMGLALVCEELAFFDRAVDAYRQVLSFDSDRPLYLRSLARCLLRLKRYEEALECLSGMGHSKESESFYLMAMAYEALGRLPDAISSLERAIDLKPDFVDALLDLVLLLPKERDELAISSLRRALEVEPERSDLHLELGRWLSGRGELDDAERHLKRSLKGDPRNLWSHLYLGELYSRRGQHRLAEREMMVAYQMEPSEFTARQLELVREKMRTASSAETS